MEKGGPSKDHTSPGWQGGVSTKFLQNFKGDFDIKIHKMDKDEMVFDMIGIDPAVANAFRRILIAEVPTMAIERVFIWENSSIIQDEVLAHRLGLIPIKADPRRFQEMDDPDNENNLTEDNTLVFKLKVKCEKKTDEEMAAELASAGGKEVKKYKHESVYSGDLKWFPNGDQDKLFAGEDIVKPVVDDILIANLRPGQAINLEIMCFKGRGQDHAKFSPVATASYRQLPKVSVGEEEGRNLLKNARGWERRCALGVTRKA
jgi:DNA-directed RNA polymerase I and III subunit RPAC1